MWGERAASPSAVAPEEWGVDLYLKDESTHPTGSLKHRLARSLFLIELHGGRCHFVERPDQVYDVAAGLARETGGHYLSLIHI